MSGCDFEKRKFSVPVNVKDEAWKASMGFRLICTSRGTCNKAKGCICSTPHFENSNQHATCNERKCERID